MFFRHKKEINPKLEIEHQQALAEFNCHMELKDIMEANNLEWHDVLNIVKGSLK